MTALKTAFNKLAKYETLFSSALIVIIGCITYLPYMNQLGLYFNDWRALDSLISGVSLVTIFSSDRPFLGYLLQTLQVILGNSQLAWHLFTLGLQITSALLLFWIFRQLWNEKKLVTTAMAAIFLVYPGCCFSPMAVTHYTDYLTLIFTFISIGSTIAAFKTTSNWRKVALTIVSLMTAVIYLAITEYYISMEVVRLAIIFMLCNRMEKHQSFKETVKTVFVHWLPYFVMMLAFLVYRLFIFHGSRNTTDVGSVFSLYLHQPLHMLTQFILGGGRAIFDTILSAWFVPLYQALGLTEYHDWAVSILLGIVAVGAFLLLVYFIRKTRATDLGVEFDRDQSGKEMMILGFLTLCVCQLLIVAVNRAITIDLGVDGRYAMPAAIGVIMLIGGALMHWVNPYRVSIGVFMLLIMIGVVTQVNNTIYYRNDWQLQRSLWWQVTWRAPQFKQGTVLMIDLPSPYYFSEDEEIYAPANYIYYPQPNNFHIYSEVINPETVIKLATNNVSQRDFRGISFPRDFSKAVIASQDSVGGCVHVYDSKQLEISNLNTPINNLAAAYSNIDQIVTNGNSPTPPADVFGKEPAHTWCYYYQKASLARQQHDWAEVARLGDEAIAKNYNAYDPLEWVPFMEGYINVGREVDALQILTRIPYGYDRTSMCTSLKNGGGAYSTGASLQRLEQMFCENK